MKKAPTVYWETFRQRTIPAQEALNMKYKQSKKQNQRITRISDKTLVVGADIAKETHVARAIDYRGLNSERIVCSQIPVPDWSNWFSG